MKIHQDAYNGDLESVQQALKQLTDLDVQDQRLMVLPLSSAPSLAPSLL